MYLIEIHFDDGSSRFIYPVYNTLDDALDFALGELNPGVKSYDVHKVEAVASITRCLYKVIVYNTRTNDVREATPATLEGVFDYIRSCREWTSLTVVVQPNVSD